jgi:hypothetical protein
MTKMRNAFRQEGNVLFLILIAVTLFAAISFAVTRSSRGGKSAGTEKSGIAAARILDDSAAMAAAMTRMRLTGGCALSQISFEPPPFNGSGGYENSGSPAEKRCHLFHTKGGGISFRKMDVGWLDPAQSARTEYGRMVFSAAGDVNGVGTTGNKTSTVDLVVFYPWIRKDLCTEIDRRLGLLTAAGAPPTDMTNIKFSRFDGDFPNGGDTIGDSGGILTGKQEGCFRGNQLAFHGDVSGAYFYYKVLAVR